MFTYKRVSLIGFFVAISLLFTSAVFAETYWGGELPDISNSSVEAEVSFDGQIYTYTYSVYSDISNTGDIWDFNIDIKKPPYGMELSGEGLTSNYIIGKDQMEYTVPVGMFAPMGWYASIDLNLRAGWGGKPFLPGETKDGILVLSPGLPGIRDFRAEAKLIPPEEGTSTNEIIRATRDKVAFKGKTIGPTAPPGNSDGVFIPKMLLENISKYLTISLNLGWLNNPALTSDLRSKLDEIRHAMQANNDPTQAKVKLGEFIDTLDQADPVAYTPEGYGLIYYNAKYLLDNMPDHIQNGYFLELSPKEPLTVLPKSDITLTAMLTENGEPLAGKNVRMIYHHFTYDGHSYRQYVDYSMDNSTNDEGEVTYNIEYERLGGATRHGYLFFTAFTQRGDNAYTLDKVYWSNAVKVRWWANAVMNLPDLVVESFFPPFIKTRGGGDTVEIKEVTANIGNYIAKPSVTRYYLSEDEDINPYLDTYLGERQVPSLEPESSSEEATVMVTLPTGLDQNKTYYLWACVDVHSNVIEKDEHNNCAKNQVVVQIAIFIEKSTNLPPDCSSPLVSVTELWPPNHHMEKISIFGITDPDGDQVTLKITGITQDEPINGLGDGDTSPDGRGVGTAQAELRSERSGTGDGRVYAINFTASDGKGGQCTGAVAVSVPHDKGKGGGAVDEGQNYDSTVSN